jgi:hypothetical protein
MSTIDHELQNLLNSRTSLTRLLEGDPVFQALQHVDKAIAALEPKALSGTKRSEGNSNVIYGVVSAQQRDTIAKAAIEYFIQTRNAPVTIKELCEALRGRGIALPEYAVSSVGGVLGKRGMFMKCPDRTGYWKLTEEFLRNSTPRAA